MVSATASSPNFSPFSVGVEVQRTAEDNTSVPRASLEPQECLTTKKLDSSSRGGCADSKPYLPGSLIPLLLYTAPLHDVTLQWPLSLHPRLTPPGQKSRHQHVSMTSRPTWPLSQQPIEQQRMRELNWLTTTHNFCESETLSPEPIETLTIKAGWPKYTKQNNHY